MVRGAEAVGLKEREEDTSKPVKPLKFADKDEVSDYAVSAVSYCESNGIINGNERNEFEPQGNVTRAEAAKMIYKLLELIDEDAWSKL